MELKNVNEIAVFKFRNIGDVLMMTPALRALRQQFPRARLTVVVNSITDSVLKGNPDLDEIIVYDRAIKEKNWFTRLKYEIELAKTIFSRRFDLTIDFSLSDRAIWYALFSRARYRAGFLHYTWGKYNWRRLVLNRGYLFPDLPMHEVEKHSWLLNKIGLSGNNGALSLAVDPESKEWAEKMLKPYRPAKIVLLHPVSRWLFKCWDDQAMAKIIDWLQKEKKAVVFMTTSDEEREREKAEKIISLAETKPVFFKGNISLSQLAALISGADCFMGVDTAPMHMAAALNVPVVALFGPSDVLQWHPWSEKEISLSKNCPCRLEGREACDWKETRACLKNISFEEVCAALETFL